MYAFGRHHNMLIFGSFRDPGAKMGYPRHAHIDSPAGGPTSPKSSSAAAKLLYVCCTLGFMVLGATTAVTLSSRLIDQRMISLGFAGAAMALFAVGISLRSAFFLRNLVPSPTQEFTCETSPSGDVLDDQLDG